MIIADTRATPLLQWSSHAADLRCQTRAVVSAESVTYSASRDDWRKDHKERHDLVMVGVIAALSPSFRPISIGKGGEWIEKQGVK